MFRESKKVRWFECLVGLSFAPSPGLPARWSVILGAAGAVILFAGGLLLGYTETPVAPVQAAPLVNLPEPIIHTAAPPVESYWDPRFLGHPMSHFQQYTCDKFGPACRVALAIQAAENLKGNCEAYHHNSDGSLDWGYFQINSVHLSRRGVKLRDLLDCKANIDFAYQLYSEEGFRPWSTFVGGQYRKFIDVSLPNDPRLRHSPEHLVMAAGLSSR